MTLLWIALGYLAIINLITAEVYASDKRRALGSRRRVSERTLWTLAAIGGMPAALFMMNAIHHKTRKSSFQFVITLILLLQITLLFILLRIFL